MENTLDFKEVFKLLEMGGFSIIHDIHRFNPDAPLDRRSGRIKDIYTAFTFGGCGGVDFDELNDWLNRSKRLGKPARKLQQQKIIDSELSFHFKRDQDIYDNMKKRLIETTEWDV
ncbi:TPA: hypothetical protein SCS57_002021 [Enterobacter cloacae]|nr:hypothetical protein [Enterobacter cloacae]